MAKNDILAVVVVILLLAMVVTLGIAVSVKVSPDPSCAVSEPTLSKQFIEGVKFRNQEKIQQAIDPDIRPTVVSTVEYIFPPNFIEIDSTTWLASCQEEESKQVRSVYVFHMTDTYTGAVLHRDLVYVTTVNKGGVVIDWESK